MARRQTPAAAAKPAQKKYYSHSQYPGGLVIPGSYVYLGGSGTANLAKIRPRSPRMARLLRSYLIMLQWQALSSRVILPLSLVVQLMIAVGFIISTGISSR